MFAVLACVPAPAAAGAFPLVHAPAAADIFAGEEDWMVARIAAADLALDIERVTGHRPAPKDSSLGPPESYRREAGGAMTSRDDARTGRDGEGTGVRLPGDLP